MCVCVCVCIYTDIVLIIIPKNIICVTYLKIDWL